jgi:hypothetical protein
MNDENIDTLLYSFENMKINKEILDLEYFEDMMDRFSRYQKNYLDFVLFVRRMVPYIENMDSNVIIGDDVKRLL